MELGKSFNFWKDLWIFDKPLIEIANNNWSIFNPNAKIKEFFMPGTMQWNLELLLQYVPVWAIHHIRGIIIPIFDCEDTPCWNASSSRLFSMKFAYIWIEKEISRTYSPHLN